MLLTIFLGLIVLVPLITIYTICWIGDWKTMLGIHIAIGWSLCFVIFIVRLVKEIL